MSCAHEELHGFLRRLGEHSKVLIHKRAERKSADSPLLRVPKMLLVHNHPSGDPTPSKADIAVTRDIISAAKPLGVTVHDHLIIGRGRHTSLRDLGLL